MKLWVHRSFQHLTATRKGNFTTHGGTHHLFCLIPPIIHVFCLWFSEIITIHVMISSCLELVDNWMYRIFICDINQRICVCLCSSSFYVETTKFLRSFCAIDLSCQTMSSVLSFYKCGYEIIFAGRSRWNGRVFTQNSPTSSKSKKVVVFKTFFFFSNPY
jgi:hypothetical protein